MKTTSANTIPNYAGFVPSLRYQFGETYGNATRHILDTDPTLKSGRIQQAVQAKSASTSVPSVPVVQKESVGIKSMSNDRSKFPPVPGYF